MMDKHSYAKVLFENLPELNIGDQVFVTYHSENETQYRTPAIVWTQRNSSDQMSVGDYKSTTLLIPHGDNNGTLLNIKQYNSGETRCRLTSLGPKAALERHAPNRLIPNEVCVEVRISMLVNTPHGLMRAVDKCDDEYPGFWIELPDTERCTTLAMVEYISGGEGTCDFNPANGMTEMRRQDNEVPPARRRPNKDAPEDAPWYNRHEVTAGFVTRAWDDEDHDEEHHYRTFHFGYTHPEVPKEEVDE